MPYDPNTILPNFGAGQPGGVASTPRYGTGPGDLGMGDLMGVTGVSGQPSMGYPAMAPPAMSMATPSQPRVLRSPGPAPAAPLPPVRPNLNVPVGQVAQSGAGSLWDALRSLFSGQPRAQNQGMTAMLNTPRSTDALGNPFNRF